MTVDYNEDSLRGRQRVRNETREDVFARTASADRDGNVQDLDEPRLALEEICTCGRHHSPQPPPTLRKPLPFSGTPESKRFRDYDDNERRAAIAEQNAQARFESADYPLVHGDMKDSESTFKHDYRQWELQKREKPAPPELRKPLPFIGESEMHSQHRPWDKSEARNAKREYCKMKDSNDLFKNNQGAEDAYSSTQARDYTPKEAERRERPPPPSLRQPLPFKGESLSRADFADYTNVDARREQCDRAKNVSDDNPLYGRLGKGKSEPKDYASSYHTDYVPKELPTRSRPNTADTAMRKPLKFQGESENRSRLREFSPDEARAAVRDPCKLKDSGGFFDGTAGDYSTTNKRDYVPKEAERREKPAAPPLRKPLKFEGSALSQESYQPWDGDNRRQQCGRAKHVSADHPLVARLNQGTKYTSEMNEKFQFQECPAVALLRETPLPQRLAPNRTYTYWDKKEQCWV
ncbi:unnamed protein product [Amoebophrya sp. A25]|nr:unnamed protein product [Amoebophrya sp. A25]|eukprot:GSA25T00017608001.1